jgi:hypothetical protein
MFSATMTAITITVVAVAIEPCLKVLLLNILFMSFSP